MEVLSIQGHTPGPIVATLSHGTRVTQLRMSLAAHPAGGWQIEHANGVFGPRCHGVKAAILLEASEAFGTAPFEYAAE